MIRIILMTTGGPERKDASSNVNRSTHLGLNTLLLLSNPLVTFRLVYNPDNKQRDVKLAGLGTFFFLPTNS